MGLGKAQDPDNARDYLVLVLGAALDTAAAHDHSGDANPAARIKFGTLAGRPAAGNPGAVYVETDSPGLSYDDGTVWHDLIIGTTAGTIAAGDHTHPGLVTHSRGSGTFNLPDVTTSTGAITHLKAYGGSYVVTPHTGQQLVGPGESTPRAANATYTSPNGESTDWECDGTYWWCQ